MSFDSWNKLFTLSHSGMRKTDFPALNLQISPRTTSNKGPAVVFFPATVDGYLDKRALHAALPAIETKYIFQVWVRQGTHTR